MADPFLGEIRIFGFTYAPSGWAVCDGGLLSIQQYSALYSLLGITYGGNGTSNFALPNLQGKAAMHWGTGAGLTPTTLGQVQGADTVTLTVQQLPVHAHMLQAGTVAAAAQLTATPSPTAMYSISNPLLAYAPDPTPPVTFAPQAIMPSGGAQPHANNQPRLALLYCIALQGIFPARS